jgi:hypothetical protein
MKIRYVIILIAVFLIFGYLIGQFIPWNLLHPVVSNKEITMNDYYTRIVSLIGAAATILATLVALFKEDIKKLYEYASLGIDFKHKDFITEILETETSGNSANGNSNLTAKKYEIVINVNNKGKLAARSCQIYLEHLSLKNSNYPQPKEFQTTGKPLQWIGKTDLNIIIPSTAKSYVSILEILSPESEIVASESTSKSQLKPQIKIAGLDISTQNLNAVYYCIFMIYSENAKPLELKLEINWNGKWEQRLTEMKNCITVKHESCNK